MSIVCVGEYVGLEEIDDGVWNVYFGPLKLGRFNERHMRIEDALRQTETPQCVTHVPGLFCYLCPRSLSHERSLSFAPSETPLLCDETDIDLE